MKRQLGYRIIAGADSHNSRKNGEKYNHKIGYRVSSQKILLCIFLLIDTKINRTKIILSTSNRPMSTKVTTKVKRANSLALLS